MEMGNWLPAFKDIFLAAKGVVVSKPLDVYPKYTGGRKFSFDTQRALERDISHSARSYTANISLHTIQAPGRSRVSSDSCDVDRPNLKVGPATDIICGQGGIASNCRLRCRFRTSATTRSCSNRSGPAYSSNHSSFHGPEPEHAGRFLLTRAATGQPASCWRQQ